MLSISRPDISVNEILDTSCRFIKFPLTHYLKVLNVPEINNRTYIALINALNSPKYRFICAALSTTFDKNYIYNILTELIILKPESHVLVVSPKCILNTISSKIKDKVSNHSNGSTVRMITTLDSGVACSTDLIIFEEAALSKLSENVINTLLKPVLDKSGGKVVFISTPQGKDNWFYRFYQRGFSSETNEWCSIHADWAESDKVRSIN